MAAAASARASSPLLRRHPRRRPPHPPPPPPPRHLPHQPWCGLATVLLRSWSEFARTGTFTGGLNLDRSVLSRPHSPPRYSAAVDGMFVPWDHEHEVNPLTGEASFVERLYYVEAADIARLREELAAVVSSSASIAKSDTAARRCNMGYWVDLRRRVRSPDFCRALRSYVGNATTYVEQEEPADTVLKKPLGEVAVM
uniref:Uncharacterized protein n=1 Tax=Oryza glumipatula TaxID=40148 RepID=A0A0E0AR29_9ORYZ